MSARIEQVPGKDHPIFITHNPARVIVRVEGRVVADTREALTLLEADYPAVQYIPREDVDMTQLEKSSHTTHCPYKGEASYYAIPVAGPRSNDAAWSYEEPYAAAAEIKGYLAFYPDRVDFIGELDETDRGVEVPVAPA